MNKKTSVSVMRLVLLVCFWKATSALDRRAIYPNASHDWHFRTQSFDVVDGRIEIPYILDGWHSDILWHHPGNDHYDRFVTRVLKTMMTNVENTAPIRFRETDVDTQDTIQFRYNLCYRDSPAPNFHHTTAAYCTSAGLFRWSSQAFNLDSRWWDSNIVPHAGPMIIFQSSRRDQYSTRYIESAFAHEVGHALSFAHPWHYSKYSDYISCPSRAPDENESQDFNMSGIFPDFKSVMWYTIIFANDYFNHEDDALNVDCPEGTLIEFTEAGTEALGDFNYRRIGTIPQFSPGDVQTMREVYGNSLVESYFQAGTKNHCSKFGLKINGHNAVWSTGKHCVRAGNFTAAVLPDGVCEHDNVDGKVVFATHANQVYCRQELTRQLQNEITHILVHPFTQSTIDRYKLCNEGTTGEDFVNENQSFFCLAHDTFADLGIQDGDDVTITCDEYISHAVCDSEAPLSSTTTTTTTTSISTPFTTTTTTLRAKTTTTHTTSTTNTHNNLISKRRDSIDGGLDYAIIGIAIFATIHISTLLVLFVEKV